jgi:hypothetical protein
MLAAGLGLRHQPRFYAQALAVDARRQRDASDAFLRQAAELASAPSREGAWTIAFTEDQINGWLAVDLEENHPAALPKECSEPRVDLAPDAATLACRLQSRMGSTVLSLRCTPYLHAANVVGLRIHGAWAGAVPLPLSEFLEIIETAAQRAEVHLEWRQADGDPVALLSLPAWENADGADGELDLIELREGELRLGGKRAAPAPDAPRR